MTKINTFKFKKDIMEKLQTMDPEACIFSIIDKQGMNHTMVHFENLGSLLVLEKLMQRFINQKIEEGFKVQ